jgi:hypothetical protein
MVANTAAKTANIVQILGRKREEDRVKMFSFGTPQITAWWGSKNQSWCHFFKYGRCVQRVGLKKREIGKYRRDEDLGLAENET